MRLRSFEMTNVPKIWEVGGAKEVKMREDFLLFVCLFVEGKLLLKLHGGKLIQKGKS